MVSPKQLFGIDLSDFFEELEGMLKALALVGLFVALMILMSAGLWLVARMSLWKVIHANL